MTNIAISELNTTATSLNDDDLILVSKTEDNGSSYTSAKMKASVLKNGVSRCQFSEDSVKNALTSYGVSKSVDLSKLSTLDQINELLTKIGNKVLETDKMYTVTLTKMGPGSDQVDGDLVGSGTYKKGTLVTILAPNTAENYSFFGWMEGGNIISRDLKYSWEITSDITLTASYIDRQFTDTIYVNAVNNSSIDLQWCGFELKPHFNTSVKLIRAFTLPEPNRIIGGVTYTIELNEKIKLTIDDTINWSEPILQDFGYFRRYKVDWNGAPIPENKIMPGTFTFTDA